MNVSDAVRMALRSSGKTQASLAEAWSLSQAAMNQKFYRASWSADDLLKVAEFTGVRLAFILQDGNQVLMSGKDEKPEGE